MKLWLLGLVFVAACDENPSRLDTVAPPTSAPPPSEQAKAVRALDGMAAPIGSRLDLYTKAVAGPRRTDAELDARLADLSAWKDAHGTVPSLDTDGVGEGDGIFALLRAAIEKRANDDRVAELVLYTTQRLRQDGTGVLAGSISEALLKQLMEKRPLPPANAEAYAPTDADIIRVFASELAWSRRMEVEMIAKGDLHGEVDLQQRSAFLIRFTEAPVDRAGFLAFLAREAATRRGRFPTMLQSYAVRLYASVDAYQRWLANRQTL